MKRQETTCKGKGGKVSVLGRHIDWLNQQIPFGLTLGQIISIVIIGSIAIVLERLITRHLRRFSRRAHLDRSVSNNLIFTFRITILIVAVAALVRTDGLDTQWFLAFSALGRAEVGFASPQTIGNLFAGLYLLAMRPFKVGDYVRLGTVEGIVQEVTINYTKLFTIGDNRVSIINLQILQRDMVNYLYETDNASFYCYTSEIGFDHSVSTEKIDTIFKEILQKHDSGLPQKPSYIFVRSDAFERVYVVYLYLKNPEDIFRLRPQIAEEAFAAWDAERSKNNTMIFFLSPSSA
jgi:small conductance mechanosensitive channel